MSSARPARSWPLWAPGTFARSTRRPRASAYTAVAETTDHGYPILGHLARLLHDGEIIWAPGLDGALLVSTRGGDYELHIGQDLSIGYLSHDAEHIQLYLQESPDLPGPDRRIQRCARRQLVPGASTGP